MYSKITIENAIMSGQFVKINKKYKYELNYRQKRGRMCKASEKCLRRFVRTLCFFAVGEIYYENFFEPRDGIPY